MTAASIGLMSNEVPLSRYSRKGSLTTNPRRRLKRRV